MGAGAAVVAKQQDQVGTDGRVRVEVVVAADARAGQAGIDELDGGHVPQHAGSMGGDSLGLELAQAVLAAEEKVRQTEHYIGGGHVEDHLLGTTHIIRGKAATFLLKNLWGLLRKQLRCISWFAV